jgi:hypothetical protein
MENNDLLKEQARRLRHIESVVCCIGDNVGLKGSKVISGTSPVTGSFQYFVVNATAVVSAILDQNGNSLMTSLGLSAVSLLTLTKITVPAGTTISSITLTSGSVVAYNS